MQIRTSSIWLLSVVGACLLIATSATFGIVWREYARAQTADTINSAMNAMVAATGDWALERSLTFAALLEPEPASPTTRARIAALRAQGKATYDRGVTLLRQRDIPVSDELLARFRQREQWLDRVRGEVDRDLALPFDRRDHDLAMAWGRKATDAIEASQQVRIDCGARVAGVISIVVKNLELRHNLWLMSEYAGRERGLIAGFISARHPMNAEDLRALSLYRSHLLEGWNIVSHYFDNDANLTAAQPQIVAIQTQFFGQFEALRSKVYAEGASGAYTIASKDWLDRATAAIETIRNLQAITEAEVDAAAKAEERKDQWVLVLAGMVGLTGWSAIGLSFILFMRNVYRPLRRLTRVAEEISSGDGTADVPYVDHTGEIGALARGLQQAGASLALQREAEAERQATQENLARLAHYDPLTGLANRVLFAGGVSKALGRLARNNAAFALLCLDLDGFKLVNDTYGHAMGDTLLCEVAQRLRGSLRVSDILARMGGDEFAIIQDISCETDAQRLAARIVEAMRPAFRIGDVEVSVGVSIGIALAPENGTDFISLLARADMAMYKAKAEGKNDWQFYDKDLDHSLQHRMRVEQELKHALALGQLWMDFQPQIDVATHAVTGYEALMRWNHPEFGLISPATFIPIAEETNRICDLGSWMIDEVTKIAARWPQPWHVAVNVSPRQFRDRRILADVTRALAASGLAPERLELEITERVILHNTDDNIATLQALRDLGVRLSMDDFGTGYSSLSYLRQFKFDKIKIDQSFISGLPEDSESAAIIRAITGMAHELSIGVTAEGVETIDQLTMLRELHCDEAQGYLIGRPTRDICLGETWAGDRWCDCSQTPTCEVRNLRRAAKA